MLTISLKTSNIVETQERTAVIGKVCEEPALAYYWDHREELDLDIRRRLERVEELRGEVQHPELAALLFASE